MLAPPPPPRVLLAENQEGDGYCVTVSPPQPIGHDRCFAGYLEARAYARLLRFGNGWELVDRVDETTRRTAIANGYPEGEAYGDHGYIATLEARLLLNRRDAGLPGQFQLIGFVDAGQVQFAKDRWITGRNHATLSGIGAGLTWFGPSNFVAKASYAHKLSDAESTSQPDKGGRAWFQIARLF